MPDREKVIEKLQELLALSRYNDSVGWNPDSDTDTLADALALLKAQEPRVLTLNEIPEHDGAVFIEYKSGDENWALYVYEDGPFFKFNMVACGGVMLPLEDYDIEWRAWTGRPTAEQRWKE